jgi:hypothetical protein
MNSQFTKMDKKMHAFTATWICRYLPNSTTSSNPLSFHDALKRVNVYKYACVHECMCTLCACIYLHD